MLAVFVTGLISFHQATLTGNQMVSGAMKESRDLWEDRGRTNISIIDTSFDPAACKVDMTLENTGSESITSLHLMDLIIQLKGANSSIDRQEYIESSSIPAIGSWKIGPALTDLEFEPEIFNPGELIEIQTMLNIPGEGETIGRVTIVTPNGVSTEAQLGSLYTPCLTSGP